MRMIDADALIDVLTQRCCKNCIKRMGIKNGKQRMIYEIGDAPCRACEVDDIKAELDDAPTIEAEPVIRCKNCEYYDPKYEYCENNDIFVKSNGYCLSSILIFIKIYHHIFYLNFYIE